MPPSPANPQPSTAEPLAGAAVITIDGPAGAGKSTVARRLAKELEFDFLDTGAMYRAVALACLNAGVDVTSEVAVAPVAASLQMSATAGGVVVGGETWTHELRTHEVTQAASYVAGYTSVRQRLVSLQRKAAAGKRIVSEGRDQGTIVFPDAACKFFLTATPERRAERRLEDLARHGTHATLDEILAQQIERDKRDETRSIAPLRPADDAITIDTSDLSEDEVVEQLKSVVRQRLSGANQ